MVATPHVLTAAILLSIIMPPALLSWISLHSLTLRARLAVSLLIMVFVGMLFITPVASILASIISTVSFSLLSVYLASRKLPLRASTIIGFAIAGFTLGLFSAALWPGEATFHVNPVGSVLGDYIYERSIKALGDERSPQAHLTIPLPLRIPWVYIPSSTLVWTVIGLFLAATPMHTTIMSLLKDRRKTH